MGLFLYKPNFQLEVLCSSAKIAKNARGTNCPTQNFESNEMILETNESRSELKYLDQTTH